MELLLGVRAKHIDRDLAPVPPNWAQPAPSATHCNHHPSSNLALSAMTNSCMLDITSPSISPLTDMKLC